MKNISVQRNRVNILRRGLRYSGYSSMIPEAMLSTCPNYDTKLHGHGKIVERGRMKDLWEEIVIKGCIVGKIINKTKKRVT